jgi:phage gp46-like protein
MSFAPAVGIFNNVYLSLTVARGSFFHNTSFGIRQRGRRKNTPATAALIRQDYLEALQWLIDTGRAKAIDVRTERDTQQDLNRLKILVTVTQADGRVLTFTTFREVV